ncbi:MAG: DUF58 domain-containing protein [Candidatus Riflebacteria bacterium]|nr:DUF58 domain-containing protein [Candidatus Riflebacteria bacterium]
MSENGKPEKAKPSRLTLGYLTSILGLVGGIYAALTWPNIVCPGAIIIALVLKIIEPYLPEAPRFKLLDNLANVAVTTRVILLALCGTLPLMLASSHTQAISFMIAYDILLFLMIYIDLRISPKLEDIEVSRVISGKLSLDEPNEVFLRLRNHSGRRLFVTLRDEYPRGFHASHRELDTPVERRSEAVVKYRVTPSHRGDFLFGNLVIRYRGIFELVERQKVIEAPTKVEVYPNLRNISRFELSVKRRHLGEIGLKPERRRGSGTEFESLREYVPGDEFRKIDWKASARKGKMISRDYQSETNQSVVIAIDCSRPMGAHAGKLTLLDFAVNASLLLGWQILKKEDKIGLLTFSDQVHSFTPPKRGKRHYQQFLKSIYNLQSRPVEPDYDKPLRFLMGARMKRSLIIILTDLTAGDAASRLRETIGLLSRKHLPIVISIVTPEVCESAAKLPDSNEDVYRKIIAIDMLNRVKQSKKAMTALGVTAISMQPHELCSGLLSNYMSVKLRGRI